MNVYGVIIAGGQGKRLWPLSRMSRPKPVLAITKEQSLIKQTLLRLERVVKTENLLVVTNEEVFAPVYEAIKEVPVGNVISEPVGRNTAAAIGLACIHITEKQGDTIAIVTPADHYIEDDEQFIQLLKKAVDVCDKSETVVIFGVKPAEPSTNYGYIARGAKSSFEGVSRVARFTEKPSRELAEKFISDGCLWNAGIFVFRTSTMLNAIKTYMPELSAALDRIKKTFKGPYERKTIKEEYSVLNDISIDKGIIEKLDNVSVIEMNIPWADLGSFEQIANVSVPKDENGNQRIGNGIDFDSKNSIVISEDNFVITANVNDIIVIASDGKILVTKKGNDDAISRVVNTLKAKGFKEYL